MNSFETERAHAKTEGSVMQVLKAGVLYFALVFGAGLALGPVRILWAVPRFGTRMAELMEIPIMLVIIIASARWIVRRLGVPSTTSSRLGMGCVALGLLLVAEFALVLWLRGMSVSEYLASRDPVSGIFYYATLGVFGAMPLLAARTRRSVGRRDYWAKHPSRRSVSNRVRF